MFPDPYDAEHANEGSTGDEEEEEKKIIPEDQYYDYEELYSRAFTTDGSNIPQNLLQL